MGQTIKNQLAELTRIQKAFLVPKIFDLAKPVDKKQVQHLIKHRSIKTISDDYLEQLKEYFSIKHPRQVYQTKFEQLFQKYLQNQRAPLWVQGRWVYFPWLQSLIHILKESEFFEVRTARNRNLIDHSEQKLFYNAKVGIAGLSVGNSVALAIALQGGARHLKLADHDLLALSNLNRIRAGIEYLGMPKIEITARQIYVLNPYTKIDLYPEGLNEKNISTFFSGLDLIIDEIDNLYMKLLIRQHAKRNRLPLVMAADNGDNGVVDIERYDLKPQPKFFHGWMGKVDGPTLKKLNKFESGRLIAKYVGAQNVAPRMQESLQQLGKTLVSWPQLGGAALLNGSAVAYCVRKILTDQPVITKRALISLDEKLIPDYYSRRNVAQRKITTTQFKRLFKL